MTHTPGPWKSEGKSFDGEPMVHSKRPGRTDSQVICYCTVQNDEDAEANARLIAAAPELLEALRAIITQEKLVARDDRTGRGETITHDIAIAAIALATGEK